MFQLNSRKSIEGSFRGEVAVGSSDAELVIFESFGLIWSSFKWFRIVFGGCWVVSDDFRLVVDGFGWFAVLPLFKLKRHKKQETQFASC